MMKAATVAANRPVCGHCQSRSTLQDQGRTKVRMPVVLPSQFFGRALSSSSEAFKYVSHMKSCALLYSGAKGALILRDTGSDGTSKGKRGRGKGCAALRVVCGASQG